MHIQGNELTISNLRKSINIGDFGDNAVYQCEAKNEHGSVWTNFYLNILVGAVENEKKLSLLKMCVC